MTSGHNARSIRMKAEQLRADAARKAARQRAVAVSVVVVAALVLLVGAGVLVQTARQQSREASLDRTPPADLVDGAIVVGSAEAPVTITIYSDYICPYCKLSHRANKAQIDAWVAEGSVKVEHRLVAFLDRASTDEYSTRALNLVAAVVDSAPDAFPGVNDALFTEQPDEGGAGLPDSRLVAIATSAGAPADAIRRAVEDVAFRGWVMAVTEEASEAGVVGTPTMEVNGTAVENPVDPRSVREAVERARGGS